MNNAIKTLSSAHSRTKRHPQKTSDINY